MRQDFLELFSVLQDGELQEYTMYNLVKNVHSLIRCGQKDAVPNALRKVHECLLYRCNAIKQSEYPLKFPNDNENGHINISATTKSHFQNLPVESKNRIIKPFLNFVNAGSHSEDVIYASIRDEEIKDNISRLIWIVNWFLSKLKDKKKFQLDNKFSLPKAETIEDLKEKLEDIKKQNEQLRKDIKVLKKENQDLSAVTEKDEVNDITESLENIEEGVVNIDELEIDVYDTIDFFNKEKIYCTHRTVAFFLFGLRINQTDFIKDLTKEKNFGKYQNNKFTEYEYDTVINQLLGKEKIFLNGFFFNTRDYSNISNEELSKEYGLQIVDRDTEMISIDENIVKTLQTAISQNNEVKFTYLKSIPNINKASVKNRHCKPIQLLSKNDYEFYYLSANDINDDNKEKKFRLDSILNLRIV